MRCLLGCTTVATAALFNSRRHTMFSAFSLLVSESAAPTTAAGPMPISNTLQQ
jgi:hypothetical protein